MTKIEPQASFNFAVAKVLAILLVVTGHFFDGTVLWVPVTVGLSNLWMAWRVLLTTGEVCP